MTTNQTIDGVMVLRAAVTLVRSNETPVKDAAIRELRALLDAPAKPVIRISLELLNTAGNGFVQEQGHAINELREILSAHKADQNVKSTSVILDSTNSGNSSNWDSNICIKPVAAQPQGEPVAWLNVATGHVTTSAVEVMDWDDEKEQVQSLYAEQPAPVAVVLPEHRDSDLRSPTYGFARGWNACLDEVARLTATVRTPEPLVMTDGLHTYEYVTGHNAAIDKMLGVKS